jgi:hypothetical protein
LFSQKITKDNFNPSEMNKALLLEFNEYRKSKGLDTLIYSKTLFDSISYPNCMEVSKSCKFYHPYIKEKWQHKELRQMIVNESVKTVGGGFKLNTLGLPWMDVYENAFRSYITFDSYKEMAKLAIKSWSLSPSHDRVQNLVFESGGLPGSIACHSYYGENNYLYIFIDFVMIHRD